MPASMSSVRCRLFVGGVVGLAARSRAAAALRHIVKVRRCWAPECFGLYRAREGQLRAGAPNQNMRMISVIGSVSEYLTGNSACGLVSYGLVICGRGRR